MLKTFFLYLIFISILFLSFLFNIDGVLKMIRPVSVGNYQLVLQLTDNGEFRRFNVKAYADSGKIIYNKTRVFIKDIADIERPPARIEISDESGKTILKTLTLGNLITNRIPINADINPSFDPSRITPFVLLKSSWNGFNTVQKAFVFLISIIIFFIAVIIPLSFVCMIFSLFMELTHNVYRPFTGSWIRLILGLGWFYIGYHFGIISKMINYPSPYAKILFIVFCSGYILYFFADRSFGHIERHSAPANPSLPSGTKHNNRNLYSKIIFSLGFVIVPLFLPIATFWHMYEYWLLPILQNKFSWKNTDIDRINPA